MEYIPSTLEKFKSYINSTGSTPARNDLYAFNMAAIPIAVPFDGTTIEMLNNYAVSVSIPPKNIMSNSVRREHAHYENPYGISYEPINVTFYMDSDYELREFFKNWYLAVHDYDTNGIGFREEYVTDISIFALYKNKNMQPSYEFKIIGAYPKSISGLQYDSSSGDQVTTFSVEFQYEKLEENQKKILQRQNITEPEIIPSTINIKEHSPEDRVSLLGDVPRLGGLGAPFLRDLPSPSDEIFQTLNSIENNLDEAQQFSSSIFSKFSPVRRT